MVSQRRENWLLCRQIAEEDSHNGKFKSALELEAGAEQARERAEMVRNTLQSEWVQPVQFWEKRES